MTSTRLYLLFLPFLLFSSSLKADDTLTYGEVIYYLNQIGIISPMSNDVPPEDVDYAAILKKIKKQKIKFTDVQFYVSYELAAVLKNMNFQDFEDLKARLEAAEDLLTLLERFDFENLVFELVGLMSDDELFTFVRHMEAAATNNEAERSLRDTALARGSGRGSKTPRGARRRSVLTTVFESLKLHLASFHLATVLAEVGEWQQTGKSLFDRLRIDVGLDPPGQPRLENLVPSAQ